MPLLERFRSRKQEKEEESRKLLDNLINDFPINNIRLWVSLFSVVERLSREQLNNIADLVIDSNKPIPVSEVCRKLNIPLPSKTKIFQLMAFNYQAEPDDTYVRETFPGGTRVYEPLRLLSGRRYQLFRDIETAFVAELVNRETKIDLESGKITKEIYSSTGFCKDYGDRIRWLFEEPLRGKKLSGFVISAARDHTSSPKLVKAA